MFRWYSGRRRKTYPLGCNPTHDELLLYKMLPAETKNTSIQQASNKRPSKTGSRKDVSKPLTQEVLEKFARIEKEKTIFKQQFEKACLHVYGTSSNLLRYDAMFVSDDSWDSPWSWHCFTDKGFFG